MSIRSLFNNTFTIERRTRTSDGQGGFTIGYTSLGTTEGRIRPASDREREIAAQEGREITHVLYVDADTDIARGDRVTTDDLIVEVLGVREPSQAGYHLEVDCLERQVEQTADS
jgi:SPP1 family predicted phage head-tail adaptor